MNEDAELLRRYVETRAEEAFTELVHRHLGLVYGTALRRVGHDAQLAEDVAQKVFADLARKASSLQGHATLAGWLYVCANFESAKTVRSERRRKLRETEAQTMQSLLHDPTPPTDWERLRPALDEVIVGLRADEREAIALRFFARRSFAEVGAALRLNEDAARKRVERALEKLRSVLARRGITSTTALLTLALGELGASTAPAGLAGKIAGHALAQGAAAGTGLGIGSVAAPLLAGAALLIGGFAVFNQQHTNRQLQAELARLHEGSQEIAMLRAQNEQLAHRARETESWRQAAADLPNLRSALLPSLAASARGAPARATITVTAEGTLKWRAGSSMDSTQPITLSEYLNRLKALQQTAPGGEATLHIRGLAEFPAVAYAIDEARKAQIRHVVVESNATPDPKLGLSWFGW